MFLNEPHNVTSFFGLIVRRLNEGKNQIFIADHAHSPYYTSALAYYKLETHFRRRNIDSAYKKVRFHILMLFRILFENEALPPLNNPKKMDKYCSHLLQILNDDSSCQSAFEKCIQVIDNADFNKDDKQDLKLVYKTRNLIDYSTNLI